MAVWAALLAGAGGAAAYNALPGGASLPSRGPRAATFQPLVFAFMQAGGDLDQIRAQRKKVNGKYGWYLPDGTEVRKSETVKIGNKDRVAIGGATQNIFAQQFQKASEMQAQQTQKTYETLFGANGVPVLKEKISQRPQQIREAFGPAASRLLAGALGGAAPRGTLTTDAVLQRAAAPVAFDMERFFQQAQDVANAQELGLSGVPGFGQGFSSNPANFLGPQPLGHLQQLGLAGFEGQYNPALANYQSRAQAGAAKAGLYGGLSSSFGAGMQGWNPFGWGQTTVKEV